MQLILDQIQTTKEIHTILETYFLVAIPVHIIKN